MLSSIAPKSEKNPIHKVMKWSSMHVGAKRAALFTSQFLFLGLSIAILHLDYGCSLLAKKIWGLHS